MSDMKYYLDGEKIRMVVGDYTTLFDETDKEGLYSKYLAWVAEGNTPEEWQPDE